MTVPFHKTLLEHMNKIINEIWSYKDEIDYLSDLSLIKKNLKKFRAKREELGRYKQKLIFQLSMLAKRTTNATPQVITITFTILLLNIFGNHSSNSDDNLISL